MVELPSNEDNKYKAALADAEVKRAEIANAHALQMRKAELGWFGAIIGNESQAGMVIAFLAVFGGFSIATLLWIAAYRSGKTEPWSGDAHFALNAATSALGFVFGRSGRDSAK